MKRTKLKDRILPNYTNGEEIFNMVSHIVGGGIGVIILALCVIKSFINRDAYQVVGSFIYGFSMIIVYTMSSVYHGLKPKTAKKVMQIMDHCAIFLLIAGTYTPILFSSIRLKSVALCWVIFGIVWGVSALGITLNAIDLKKYNLFSMICYIALGWCIVLVGKTAMEAMGAKAFFWILLGGISYTVGAVFFAVAAKKQIKYIHSVFHLFVVIGSFFQFIGLFFYILV